MRPTTRPTAAAGVLTALVLLAPLAGAARAQSQDPAAVRAVAPLAAASPVSAHGDLIAFSDQGPDGLFRLVVRRGVGAPVILPLAPRTRPFDADLGPGPDGAPVVAYSRCPGAEPALAALGGLLPDWRTGRGCDLFLFDLSRSTERRLDGASTASASETLPSVWGGRVAFVRRYERRAGRRGQLPYVYLRPIAGGPSVRLKGGARGMSTGPGPLTLDLRGRRALYTWSSLQRGGPQTEVRIADARDGSVRRLDAALSGRTGRAVQAAGFGTTDGAAVVPHWIRTRLGGASRSGVANLVVRLRRGSRGRAASLLGSSDSGLLSAAIGGAGVTWTTVARGQSGAGDCADVRPRCEVQTTGRSRFVSLREN